VRLKNFDQTKHISHCPWCGDDIYGLGWGNLMLQIMVVVKDAHHYGDNGLPQ
jgi:hypothetical protein